MTRLDLRARLDAMPRPLTLAGYVQIIGANDTYYTVGLWRDLDEALFLLQYMQEERAKCTNP